jgi:glycosyltransferase involved in cell wall biosynthesis
VNIGIVAPDLRDRGGVTELTLFVATALQRGLGAAVRIVSLATSSTDAASALLHRPQTWRARPPTVYSAGEFTVEHVGAAAGEIEIARYWPRRALALCLAGLDVVHVVGGTPAWAWAARDFRGPLIVQFATFARHERVYQRVRSAAGAWRRAMTAGVSGIERAALRRAQVVIALNETRRREARALAPDARHVTVHHGVDVEWFAPGPPVADGYLLTVGRLRDPRKNLPLLLRAYAEARRRSRRVPRLVLAGFQTPSAEHWRLIAALGIESVVEYRGAPARAELAELYRGASAFVLSSDEEGQGIVVLEAMACGLPVIATACIGPPELVTDGEEGLLVPPGDVDSLSRAIAGLADDGELRRRLGRHARLRALREFSTEAAVGRVCGVYRDAGLLDRFPAGHSTARPSDMSIPPDRAAIA